MPYINIKITDTGVTNEQKQMLISGATRLVVEILQKNPETTHVIIEEVSDHNWGVAGKQVSERIKTN